MTVLIALTLANLLILSIRNVVVGDDVFNSLRSNLFISSLLTLIIALLIVRFYEKLNGFLFWMGVGLWVLFYPNCPYMISDLIHVGAEPKDGVFDDLIIYDTFIIFGLAMLSVFYGFITPTIMFKRFAQRYSRKFSHCAINITLVLSCLGFYMGRKLLSSVKLGNGYLYSWELYLEPIQIVKIVWHTLWPIGDHLPVYAMMALFGFVQYMLLFTFYYVNDIGVHNSIFEAGMENVQGEV